ncbi:restriction endonuclease subunit S [Lactiplantibacillus plantarum]|uniref:restriction endonuclease subunit S n=1 Tax=Lactiplantibacillus plantarum TaxID=1590 RepID=UPI003CF67475
MKNPKWFSDDSSIGWLRIADVTQQNGRIRFLEQHISKLGQEKTRVLNTQHLLLSIAATVGKPVMNYVSTGVHDGFLIFLNPIFNLEYMFQWLGFIRPTWGRYGQPGSQVNLNSDIVRNKKVLIPTIDEQKKISSLLKRIDKTDDLIATNEDKLEQLKTLKKLMMQKIFSQEWRFKGFTDPWEQRKLFDTIKQVLDYRGKTPKKLNMKWNEEPKGYLALSAINVKAGYIDKHIETYYASEKLYKKWMGKDSLSAGDILFTTEAPMGNVALVPDKGKYILSQRTIAFKLDKAKLDNLFWLEFLESTIFKSKAVAISSGGTAQGVSQKSLRQVIVIIPSDVNEQKRIGQVLFKIDSLIAANEDKLNQLKKLKKYLMQNMFV